MPSKELNAALKLAEERNLRFVSLQFTDIVGAVKSVQVPMHQLEEAVEHGKWFDGSSIEGFARIAESDMFLVPDLSTFSDALDVVERYHLFDRIPRGVRDHLRRGAAGTLPETPATGAIFSAFSLRHR